MAIEQTEIDALFRECLEVYGIDEPGMDSNLGNNLKFMCLTACALVLMKITSERNWHNPFEMRSTAFDLFKAVKVGLENTVRQEPAPDVGLKDLLALQVKAAKWDALDQKISKCYVNSEGEELEGDEGGDLVTIGELSASAFGYL